MWEDEKTKEQVNKLEAFEKRIEKKHDDLVTQLQIWSASIVKIVKPSYSEAAVPRVGGDQVTGLAVGLPHVPAPVLPVVTLTAPPIPQLVPQGNGRVRLGSSNAAGRQKKKAVVGTSNSVTSGRKMRSPPADIFVWGVHPQTTLEDIVNDLADSDIKIETKDILKKSKDEAPLNSYKISVQASDLQKALNPEIWPLRVKVREYIYYPSKPRQQNEQRRGQQNQQGQHLGQQHGQEQGQQPPQGAVDSEGLPISNRFGPLIELGGASL